MTARQRQLFDYIAAYIEDNGRSPSYIEMGNALGITPGAVATRVGQLRRLGWIGSVDRHQVRGLRVLRYPKQVR